MTPEELVQQLRLPDRIHIGRMMFDAADMIDRLRAELAEKDMDTRDMDAYDDRWFALHTELDEARDAIARVRELCDAYAIDEWRFGVPVVDLRAAIEGNQP